MTKGSFQLRPYILWLLTLVILWSVWSSNPAAVADEHRWRGGIRDPFAVTGPGECAECHIGEPNAWYHSSHYDSHYRFYSSREAADRYLAALNIDRRRLGTDTLCDTCHGTPIVDQFSGELASTTGVSCESCHGQGGGHPGYINPHGSYGYSQELGRPFTREEESLSHYLQRIALNEAMGWLRADRIYGLAQNCVDCHLAVPPELVAAGHEASLKAFELVAWFSGEMRHNFFVSDRQNAISPSLWHQRQDHSVEQRRRVEFVIGVLVDFEVNMRNMARGLDHQTGGALRTLAKRRLENLILLFSDFVFEYEDFDEPVPEWFAKLDHLASAIDLSAADPQHFLAAAASAKELGSAFEDQGYAINLELLDPIFDDEIGPAKGEPYSPGGRQ